MSDEDFYRLVYNKYPPNKGFAYPQNTPVWVARVYALIVFLIFAWFFWIPK